MYAECDIGNACVQYTSPIASTFNIKIGGIQSGR